MYAGAQPLAYHCSQQTIGASIPIPHALEQTNRSNPHPSSSSALHPALLPLSLFVRSVRAPSVPHRYRMRDAREARSHRFPNPACSTSFVWPVACATAHFMYCMQQLTVSNALDQGCLWLQELQHLAYAKVYSIRLPCALIAINAAWKFQWHPALKPQGGVCTANLTPSFLHALGARLYTIPLRQVVSTVPLTCLLSPSPGWCART